MKAYLRQRLPEYMVPSMVISLAALPRTTTGKVDRKGLPRPVEEVGEDGKTTLPQTILERELAEVWGAILGLRSVGIDTNFFDLGGTSIHLVRVLARARELARREVSMVDLFRHPTVRSLAAFCAAGEVLEAAVVSRPQGIRGGRARAPVGEEDIAVIAMAGRFPGAGSPMDLWENLRRGVESIARFSERELLAAGVSPQQLARPEYVRAGASVAGDIAEFDAFLFGFNPREAELLDPQHRLLLECAWELLERAGYDPAKTAGRIGVMAGAGMSRYLLDHLYGNRDLEASVSTYQMMLATEKDFLPLRLAYKLDLTGPAVNVQTACSTSLVAVHQACESLRSGASDMVLAGGVSLALPQRAGYLHQEGMILSADGHCRAFDAAATGTVGGSGAALVLLKRASEALADGDHVHALIKGSAVNNDGGRKVGFTAPDVERQAAVIAEAQINAGVPAETITYMEAHGTGTALGDPIEFAALTQAFRQTTEEVGFCALGSVKTNLGHLDTAAGVTGLIKTALALEHGEIPPSLHFETPHPEIDFARSPFFVNTRLRRWKTPGNGPRRAGVSAFGIGGTNAHAVLEEAPGRPPSAPSPRPCQLLPVSAATPTALEASKARLRVHLEHHPDLDLADVAHTLGVGRRDMEYRSFSIGSTWAEVREGLATGGVGEPAQASPGVVFLFPGQGAQRVDMGRELYGLEGGFRRRLDEYADRLRPPLKRPTRRPGAWSRPPSPSLPSSPSNWPWPVCGEIGASSHRR